MSEQAAVERVTPLFFGPPARPLFGLYHAPNPALERDFGVLLCNPWGQEYVRAHRAMAQLGLRLARQGFAVLRFDYTGAGDSSGEDADGSLAQWQADVRVAIQELKRRARVEEIFLAGLRLGASLAALVAAGRDDVEGLVLWEPVVSGVEYIAELKRWHEEKEYYFLNQPPSERGGELLGFGLHPNLLAELEALDLCALKRRPAPQVLILENNAAPSVEPFRAHLEQTLGARVEYALLEGFKMWQEDPDKGLVPHQILEAATGWLAKAAQ